MVHEQLAFLYDNYFSHNQVASWDEIPYHDEPFISAWEEYIRDIPSKGIPAALSQRLVQLRFPVRAGMSNNPNYQAATRRGLPTAAMPEATGARLEQPAGLQVYLYKTMAGRIPVIETSSRSDFETLVRVFCHRNEPAAIPASIGSCMIKGYNNWDRVAKYKQKRGADFDFNEMKTRKELYQDPFIILTDAEYSGVPAQMLGLADDEWRRLSMLIRREHEATHYFTLRFLGSARNHLLDEFIADYMGIVAATGRYRADWFLCFMGLEHYPAFRLGGRLTNYLKADLSEEAFADLKSYIKRAAENVEKFTDKYNEVYSAKGKYEMLLRLSKTNLIELASDDAEELLLSHA
jgi:hypothetical protein